ncbi:MAG TPA: hypothetical protein VMU32_02580 [Solirubrobacteraceae bacterium]|nr:hypothetical protein [Solirubrobacteraceae bacterium]
MPHLRLKGRPAALATLPLMLLACGGLAACGGSSPTTTSTSASASTTHAAAGTATAPATSAPTAPATGAPPSGTSGPSGPAGAFPPHGATGPGAGRFAAIRGCLQKDGVTLPRPGASGGGPSFLGGGQTPKGMTSAQYRAALEKCGAHVFPHGSGSFRGRSGLASPAFRTALAKFGDCLREHGVKLPPANTSGKGPIFDTKGVDTASPTFREAERTCRSTLLAGLRARRGAAGTSAAR